MFPTFLQEPVDEVAQKLLGCLLVRELGGEKIIVRIVETESYDEEDEASHAYRGETKSNQAMFGPAGHLYVYFTYGMHYCCNVVTGKKGYGSGVLIRAVEPMEGLEILESRRGLKGINLTNGPAKLTRALAIDKSLGGHDLRLSPLKLIIKKLNSQEKIVKTTRIGISRAKDKKRRFYLKDNPYVSKK